MDLDQRDIEVDQRRLQCRAPHDRPAHTTDELGLHFRLHVDAEQIRMTRPGLQSDGVGPSRSGISNLLDREPMALDRVGEAGRDRLDTLSFAASTHERILVRAV